MSMTVEINGKEYKAEHKDGAIAIEGSPKEVELLSQPDRDVYHLRVNGTIYTVSTAKGDEGGTRIHHDGQMYETSIKGDREKLLLKYMEAAGGGISKDKQIKAPMPGLVVKINCSIGDEISKGDKAIVIEAMKMENALASPGAGKVKAINVKEGQAVEKNTLLIELE